MCIIGKLELGVWIKWEFGVCVRATLLRKNRRITRVRKLNFQKACCSLLLWLLLFGFFQCIDSHQSIGFFEGGTEPKSVGKKVFFYSFFKGAHVSGGKILVMNSG